jgi:hypothetical protein
LFDELRVAAGARYRKRHPSTEPRECRSTEDQYALFAAGLFGNYSATIVTPGSALKEPRYLIAVP